MTNFPFSLSQYPLFIKKKTNIVINGTDIQKLFIQKRLKCRQRSCSPRSTS
jgi:hypothetical protein